jgi:chaperone modulatory protein CbpM
MSTERYVIHEVAQRIGVNDDFVIHCLRCEWISPAKAAESGLETCELDEEDLARLQLIRELRDEFGVNDEAVPIILRLIDQVHWMRARMRRAG